MPLASGGERTESKPCGRPPPYALGEKAREVNQRDDVALRHEGDEDKVRRRNRCCRGRGSCGRHCRRDPYKRVATKSGSNRKDRECWPLFGATEKWLDFVFLLVVELAFHFGVSVAETSSD